METCRLHIHAETKLFKLFLLSLDQVFFLLAMHSQKVLKL